VILIQWRDSSRVPPVRDRPRRSAGLHPAVSRVFNPQGVRHVWPHVRRGTPSVSTTYGVIATLSSRGQIVIPPAVRERCGLGAGDHFVIEDDPETQVVALSKVKAPGYRFEVYNFVIIPDAAAENHKGRACGVGQYRDADGDRILDWREQQYFASLTNCAPDADPSRYRGPELAVDG